MRTQLSVSILGAAALAVLVGCTVKDVDQPALAGPSTLGYSIVLVTDNDTLTKDGVSTATIRITGRNADGQEVTGRPLRAVIMVDGVVQDYGVLSTKTPVTGSTLRYTAPAGSAIAMGNTAETVTIAVTPTDSGDYRGEFARQLDIRLVPQGVILPTNPNLVAAFTFNPAAPLSFQIVSFDATTSTNAGVSCGQACSYAWDFGDGTSGTGQTTTHQFRSSSLFNVTLTVTDSRGATAMSTKSINVAPPAPPTTVDFTMSPASGAFVDQTVFFNASASRAAAGRTLVSYEWDFGKGTTGTGVTASKGYDTAGTYTVTLKVTDDAGAIGTTSKTVTVVTPQIVPSFTVLPTAPLPFDLVSVNAAETKGPDPIVSYSWSFGTGSSPSSGTGVSAVTSYTTPGNKVITLTVTDSAGRTSTITRPVTVANP